MEKITFENSPSTNTPLNASNLNTLQSNVEDAFNNTYGTSQTEGYSQEYINKIGTQKNGFGDLLTTDGTYSADYYAKAVATKIGSKLWRVETEGQILNNNSGTNYFNWGVSIDKINTLLGLTLKTNNQTENTSSYDYFTNGSRDAVINGIATKFEYNSNINALLLSRIYTSSGASGGWSLDSFADGSNLKAVIYLEESE